MGVYVYTLRAENRTINLGDTKVVAHLLKYAFKVTYRFDGNNRTENAMLTRAENFWKNKQISEYVVIGDKFQEGAEVHSDYPHLSACYDIPNFPGKLVGYLKRDGRQWTVVKNHEA